MPSIKRQETLSHIQMSGEEDAAIRDGELHGALFGATDTAGLKKQLVRGGTVTIVAQGLKFALQMGATMVLARLLSPEDFGLQAMVVAMLGFLGLFRDAGLSVATVQRDVITPEQTSTLFWINVAVGVTLAIVAVCMAPLLAAWFRESRLVWLVVVSASAFIFNGLTVQHQALLYRKMRFVTIAKIDITALGVGAAAGIVMAVGGCGYWSLIGMGVAGPVVTAAGVWLAMPWRPGRPRRRSGVRSMLHFGGTALLNSLVVYCAYNVEKILLGRFWGAEMLGLYGRAYQLANLPVQQLNSSINSVAFPALSRIQNDPERLRTSFLKGYGILVSLTIPVTIVAAVFAEEIVRIVLGPNWTEASGILRLLMPSILAFAVINPVGWILMATGRVVRNLRLALLIAPVVIVGISVGLPFGPKGVAAGYSVAMTLLIVPVITWAFHGTGIALLDVWSAIRKPALAGLLSGIISYLLKIILGGVLGPIPLLAVGLVVCAGVFGWTLLIALEQRKIYADLVNQIFR